jgi:hypothetical protein
LSGIPNEGQRNSAHCLVAKFTQNFNTKSDTAVDASYMGSNKSVELATGRKIALK